MIDSFRALWGRKSCPWCVERPSGWYERQFSKMPPWLATFLIFKVDTWLPLWKIGQAWHWKVHARNDEVGYDHESDCPYCLPRGEDDNAD